MLKLGFSNLKDLKEYKQTIVPPLPVTYASINYMYMIRIMHSSSIALELVSYLFCLTE